MTLWDKSRYILSTKAHYWSRSKIQGLPSRGSQDDSNSPQITEWMNKKSNKYTSLFMCLQIMALGIVSKLSQVICDSACFTIIMYYGWWSHEQKNQLKGIYHLNKVGRGRNSRLYWYKPLSQCHGQGYNRSSNMSRCKGGVAAHLCTFRRKISKQ